MNDTNLNDCCEHGVPLCCPCKRCDEPSSDSRPSACSVPPRRNPVRVLNDALHEYRTQHTDMSKDEFYERGCYHAFMWAWQRAAQNNSIHEMAQI